MIIEHNLIMMNRYCNDLHDDERIIFCKIDHIFNEFKRLNNYKKDVVLIIANGDITFNDYLLSFCPKNVKHIFATNTTCDNDFVTPIPIGVSMEVKAKREGHGGINSCIFEKKSFLLNEVIIENTEIKNEIYANFNIYTNYGFRRLIKEISLNSPHINYEFGISYYDFVKKVQSHIGTLSPKGNGIECVRTYELLYLKSIPIVIGNYQEYKPTYEKIYKNLPIVFIDNPKLLEDYKFIENQINKVKNNSTESIDYFYWLDKIKNKINSVL